MTLEPGPGAIFRYSVAEGDTARFTGRAALQAIEEWIAMTKAYTPAITRGDPKKRAA